MTAVEHKWNCELGRRWCVFTCLVALSSVILSGCGTLQPSVADKAVDQRRRLQAELSRTQAKLEELRGRNRALDRQSPPPTERRTSSFSAESKVEPVIKSVGSAETGEHFLYGKVIESYRRRSTVELNKSLYLLLKTYPESVFADNALYLAGLAALEEGDSSLAKSYMGRVLNEYANGNKAVSALFASALIEKRNRNYNEASRLLKRVRTSYPGSPEAMRAELEMKLLESAPIKGRSSK